MLSILSLHFLLPDLQSCPVVDSREQRGCILSLEHRVQKVKPVAIFAVNSSADFSRHANEIFRLSKKKTRCTN